MAEKVDSYLTLKAIQLLNPKAAVSVIDDPDNKGDDGEWEETIAWSGHYYPNGEGTTIEVQPKFSLEEIRAKYPEAQIIINNEKIGRSRETAYGRLQDQLDKIYHDIDAGKLDETGEWFKSIKAVKDANPFE